MSKRELSIVIPARNEQFLNLTVERLLKNIRANTEIIVVCDGKWPDLPIPQNDRLSILFFPVSIGQRAATNKGVVVSRAKYIMKMDAHCEVEEGFDEKLLRDMQPDLTMIPRMYNLHAFDWGCRDCGHKTYQGPKKCEACKSENVEMILMWQPRWKKRNDFMRFNRELLFKYWQSYEKRPEARGDIAEVMGCLGACWLMERERYWTLGGLDERHGSWGQMGVEIACKSWLSGGRMVVNKKTWFSHLFRTQEGFKFPYEMRGEDQEKAREYSRDLWLNNKWDKAIHPLSWLVENFAPVPDWE